MAVMATAATNLGSAASPWLVYPHVVKEPGYCGGKAAIDGTRVCVVDVAFMHKCGKTVTEILDEYDRLTPAQVHAAIAYYYDHVDEIEATLAEDLQEYERQKAEFRRKTSTR